MTNYKYLKLSNWLRNEIASGSLTPGSKIPPEMELAKRFQLSRNTVRQGLRALEEDNLLYRIQGSGTFVTKQLPQVGFSQGKKFSPLTNKCVVVMMNNSVYSVYPLILEGIRAFLSEKGYSMNVILTSHQISLEKRALESLLAGNYAGLIFEPAKSGFPLANQGLLMQIAAKMPCVFLHANYPDIPIPSIQIPDKDGISLVTRHLIEHGHTNIAGFFRFDEYTGKMRYSGYIAELLRHGIDIYNDRIFCFADDYTPVSFFEETGDRLLSVLSGCTAAVCMNDVFAVRLTEFLQKKGIGVPGDISIVGFDDVVSSIAPWLELTTIKHPKEEFGNTAAKAIYTLIEDPEALVDYRFAPVLVQRNSVRQI